MSGEACSKGILAATRAVHPPVTCWTPPPVLSATIPGPILEAMWPNSEDTQELLANARQGDAAAVDRLLARHRGAVRRMVQMRMDPVLARRVDASDVAQDVLVEAHRRLKQYLKNPQMPFHLWLRQMAKDRLIDAHRRHRVAARRSLDREQPLDVRLPRDESTRSIAMQLCDGQLTPAAAATWRELKRRFEDACRQLEPQDQEIVVMRHFEQLSNSDVAVALELSPQAASMRYLRAMRRLRELLSDEATSK
jgi:RNA polymerase sigma-70 factor, ECF subfamily